MASFEGVLSGIPGLSGYFATRQLDEQRAMQGIQQAGGLLGLQNQIDAQNEAQQVRGILASSPSLEAALPRLAKAGPTGIAAATHLAGLEKARKDLEFTAKLGDLSGLTPQQLDALGGKLAVGGHPGAATVMNIADKRRAQFLNDAALSSMRGTVTSEAGPTQPQGGGVPPFLMNSPYVGDSAKALLDRVNAGAPGLTAASVEKNIEQLATAHNTAKQAEALVGLRGAEARKTKETAPAMSKAAILDKGAIEQAATRYRVDGTLPPNLGRGNQGAANSAMILKRAAEMAKEEGQTTEEARINQIANKASSMALGQLTKQKNMVLAFEKNALRNADLVLQESSKTDRLGSPAIDRWLLAGRKGIAGDAQVARLDAAMRTFVNEYARVTTSVTGGGITSDTARREIETLLASKHTKEQVREVVDLMKTEMENRRIGYEQQEKDLTKSISASGRPASKTIYIETRKTADGRTLGKTADGKIEEIK